MSTVEMKEKLIEKIRETNNPDLLEDAFRLLKIDTKDIEIFKLTDPQKRSITEARVQITNGEFLTDAKANKEINEWLKK